MALGATPLRILSGVVSQSVALALLGAGFGIVTAFGLAGFLRGVLYGTSPFDMATFLLATLGLMLVALIAVLVPAFRATRVDPAVAIQSE